MEMNRRKVSQGINHFILIITEAFHSLKQEQISSRPIKFMYMRGLVNICKTFTFNSSLQAMIKTYHT